MERFLDLDRQPGERVAERVLFATLRTEPMISGWSVENWSPSATIGNSTPSASGIRSFLRTSRLGVSTRTSSASAASASETAIEWDTSGNTAFGILTELAVLQESFEIGGRPAAELTLRPRLLPPAWERARWARIASFTASWLSSATA
ncbi:MAG: hypothetical protein H6Q91_1027 [Deltaproteobacteria bacterium]|nr:hypothetical protein [Deltaproteobacteria bacterium]